MNILIYGAGTIGTTYAWLLSKTNQIEMYVKQDKFVEIVDGYHLHITNVLNGKIKGISEQKFNPILVQQINREYDIILVTVNRYQLEWAIPQLEKVKKNAILVFLQNNWNIESDLSPYFRKSDYVLAFPASVGGGRYENHINVFVFNAPTLFDYENNKGLTKKVMDVFNEAGIRVKAQKDFISWLKVHYLQQSITSGAILRSGGYKDFASDYSAVKRMVLAYREGLRLCKFLGVKFSSILPIALFCLPVSFVTVIMKNMLNKSITAKMIQEHMRFGLNEWIAGFYEILQCGNEQELSMEIWKSYKPYVDQYCKQNELYNLMIADI